MDKNKLLNYHLSKTINNFHYRFTIKNKIKHKFIVFVSLIITKTRFCLPSLADGRDLLQHILPADQNEWRPSMNLYELI